MSTQNTTVMGQAMVAAQVKPKSRAELEAQIAALEAQLSAQRKAEGNLSLKVSEKGAVSVYGMGRFPVTLYAEQWPKLLKISDQILAFIEANKARLKYKNAESDQDE